MPSITRRDFLNGTALTIASGLTPNAQLDAVPSWYPPAMTGMRGQHPGSFETAHAFARDGRDFGIDDAAVEQSYDLVVVGGGSRRRRLRAPCHRRGRSRGPRTVVDHRKGTHILIVG